MIACEVMTQIPLDWTQHIYINTHPNILVDENNIR